MLVEAASDEQRYGFCGRLFDEYRAYNLDSSFVYAQRKEELAHRMDKLDYLDDAAMNMAEVMGTTGMYKEALELLGKIDKKTLPDYLYGYYYHLYRTIYGLMGDYAVTEKAKKEYYRMTDLYRDSLLQINASDSLGHSSGEKVSYWGAWQILRHLGGLGIYVTSLFSTYVDYKPEEEKIQYYYFLSAIQSCSNMV